MKTKATPKSACLEEQEAERHEKLRKKIVAIAKATVHEDGVEEIDDDAKVSLGNAGGCYVQSWVWVENPEKCPTCGSALTFTGYCPTEGCTQGRTA